MRISPTKIKKSEKQITLDALYQAASRMTGKKPATTLIDSLLTESEKLMFGRRILIAQLILSGKTQREICGRLSVSPNTYTLTRKWLKEQMPGYDEALKLYKTETKERAEKRQAREASRRAKRNIKFKHYPDRMSFAGLRQRYPMHFLLFDLAESLLSKTKDQS